jgi:peptidoglycan L-alanyl-D-glutamate endopeptidase CwlK
MSVLKKLAQMHPDLFKKYQLFEAKMNKEKIPFMLTSVARTVKEQVALYSQGRDPINTVNLLRKAAKLAPITSAQNIKVTWTLTSKHLIDLDDGTVNNDFSRAFDIAIIDNKKPSWNLKVDVNKDKIPDYIEAGNIGESVGLVWGGRFKNSRGVLIPDYPHYQI